MALPGETLTSALDRILACDYGLHTTGVRAYLGSYDRVHDGEAIRVFVFTASCHPLQICRQAWIAHCWADPASLPEQASQELARLTDLAMQAAEPSGALPGRWQRTAVLRAGSKGMYCDQAAAELLIRHGLRLRRDDFTARFVLTGTGQAGDITAAINWEEAITALHAGDLPCSSSEAAILGLAASLATATPVVLRHAITGLDQANLYLVINAIRDAGGHK